MFRITVPALLFTLVNEKRTTTFLFCLKTCTLKSIFIISELLLVIESLHKEFLGLIQIFKKLCFCVFWISIQNPSQRSQVSKDLEVVWLGTLWNEEYNPLVERVMEKALTRTVSSCTSIWGNGPLLYWEQCMTANVISWLLIFSRLYGQVTFAFLCNQIDSRKKKKNKLVCVQFYLKLCFPPMGIWETFHHQKILFTRNTLHRELPLLFFFSSW